MSDKRQKINQLSLEKQLAWYKKELDDKNLIINTILESAPVGYSDWLMMENTEYLSPTLKKMFGYEDHEMENTPDAWQAITHPDDLQDIFTCLDKHVGSKGEIPFRNTARYYIKNGGIVHLFCNGHVVEWDNNDKPIRMIRAYFNITPLQKIERQLSERNAELEDFAYATSHDLKEPLRTVSSFIDLIRNNETTAEQQTKYMDIVDQAAKRMTSLIQGLLDHSRISKDLTASEVIIRTELDIVCTDLKHSIDSSKATIKYSNELPTISAYPSVLRTLFQNLISNAIKFTAEDIDPEINIYYKENKQYHIFNFQDNGIGIDVNKQEKIFKLFTRLHSAQSYEGIGIGLTHCKKIAQLHKGHIEVNKNKEGGTTFAVHINKTL